MCPSVHDVRLFIPLSISAQPSNVAIQNNYTLSGRDWTTVYKIRILAYGAFLFLLFLCPCAGLNNMFCVCKTSLTELKVNFLIHKLTPASLVFLMSHMQPFSEESLHSFTGNTQKFEDFAKKRKTLISPPQSETFRVTPHPIKTLHCQFKPPPFSA